MSERIDPIEKYWHRHETIVIPLIEGDRLAEAIDLVEQDLLHETDPEIRSLHLMNLTSFLTAAGRHSESYESAKRCVEEFPDDPLAWSSLAGSYFFAFHRPGGCPTPEDQAEALECWRRALAVANEQNSFFRAVAFSFCRGLTEWEMWSEAEDVMRQILAHLDGPPCRQDTRRLEGDWIEKIPSEMIDEALRKEYQTALISYAEGQDGTDKAGPEF